MKLAQFLSLPFFRTRKARRTSAPRQRRVILERLEDRSLLAALYVAKPEDWIVIEDVIPLGLSDGDTVEHQTQDLPGPMIYGTDQFGHIYPRNAFGSIQTAVDFAITSTTLPEIEFSTIHIDENEYVEDVSSGLGFPGRGIIFSPGLVSGLENTAVVTIEGSLTIDSNDTVLLEIYDSEFDRFIVNGAVGLNDASLSLVGDGPVNGGTPIALIRNLSEEPTLDDFGFAGLLEGTEVTLGSVTYTITYNADGGVNDNDVALIDNSAPPPAGTIDLTDGNLTVTGTAEGVVVFVNLKPLQQIVEVTISSQNATPVSQSYPAGDITGQITINGSAGDDDIKIDNLLTNAAFVFGGEGNDLINAGGGSSVLVGGEDNDILIGGKERDLLIGGNGSDILEARGDQDILIAGSTLYDDVAAVGALLEIMALWNAGTYQARTSLTGTLYTVWLNDGAVYDDGADDILRGGAGLDWFFANIDEDPDTLNEDLLEGHKPREAIVDTDLNS